MTSPAIFGLSVLVGFALSSTIGLIPTVILACLYACTYRYVYAAAVIFAALRRVRGDRPDMLEKF